MDSDQEKQPRGLRPVEGWALEAIAEADKVHHGTLRTTLSASPLRRQSIFLVLASLTWLSAEAMAANIRNMSLEGCPSDATPIQVISHGLVACRRVRDLLHAAYGTIDGLIGALKRLGDDPLPREAYRNLLSLLTEPAHLVRARVLEQMSEITPDHLTTLLWLEEPFVLKELVERLSADDVTRFWTAISMVSHLSPQATTEDLIVSIKSLEPSVNISLWLQNQVRRATKFPINLRGLDQAFTPLTSAEQIRAKALEYRNCLKSQFGDLALGRKCYLEYMPSPAIVELVALSEGRWACFDRIYGPRNARLNSATRRAILRKLKASGVLVFAHHVEISRWNSVAKWLNVHDYDEMAIDDIFDLSGFEDVA